MNILFISEYYPPKIMGGGEINLALLAEALAQKKNQVIVLTSRQDNLPEIEKKNEVKIIRKLRTGSSTYTILSNLKRSFIFPLSIAAEIKKIITQKKIDVIHFSGTSIIAAQKLNDLNIPLFATIESYPSLCPKGDRIFHNKEECNIICSPKEFVVCQQKCTEIGKMPNRFYVKYNPLILSYVYNHYKRLNQSLPYCNLIAISSYVQNILQLHGLSSIVIPNIINYKLFTAKEKRKEQVTSTEKTKILYLGSLTRFKGPQILLEAVKELKDTSYHVDFYGEGNLKEDLLQTINRDNIDATIHQPVSYSEIPSIYKNTDVVVFPSLWPEPFGRIAIEALAAGKAVIASSIGGIKETLKDHPESLIEPGNVHQLRNAIKKEIEKRSKKSEENITEIAIKEVAKYSEENITSTLLAAYEQGIKKNLTEKRD